MFTTGDFEGWAVGENCGALLLVGLSVGDELIVGEEEGLGPGPVGASVGAGLKHLSVLIPKHAPELHPDPEGQGSAVMQFNSASWYVSPQKYLLKMGDLEGGGVITTGLAVGE